MIAKNEKPPVDIMCCMNFWCSCVHTLTWLSSSWCQIRLAAWIMMSQKSIFDYFSKPLPPSKPAKSLKVPERETESSPSHSGVPVFLQHFLRLLKRHVHCLSAQQRTMHSVWKFTKKSFTHSCKATWFKGTLLPQPGTLQRMTALWWNVINSSTVLKVQIWGTCILLA